MKKFSELSLYCKAGVIVAVTATPIVIYKGARLAYKWYQNKYRKIDGLLTSITDDTSNIEDVTNTDVEVNL